MAAGRRIEIQFLGRDVSAGKTAIEVEGKFSKVSSRMSKVGAVAGKALAGGFAIAGAAAVQMARNAAEDEAAQRKLETALKNTTGATKDQVAGVEDWISKQGKVLGVTDDELRPAFQRLAQATGDIGEAQKLAAVAMDASAGSGKSLKVVTEAMAKAQNGNMGALSKLGIKVKDADGKMLSFKDAVKGMSDTFKGQASAAANSYDGKLNRLKVQFDETKESIGAKLLPVMGKLMDLTTKLVGWTTKHSRTAKILAGVVVGFTAGIWAASAAVSAFTTVMKVWKAMVIVARNVQLAWNLAMMANPIGLVIVAIAALAAGLVIAYKKSKTFRDVVDGALRAVGAAATWLWNKAFQPAIRFIINGLGWLMDKFGDMLAALGKVPGFGWAKDAADKLHNAADRARDLADGIKKIPKNTTVNIKVKTKYADNKGIGGADQGSYNATHRAMGGPVRAGQPYIVGERRPELFVPSQSGRIVPRVPTSSRGGGDVHIHFNGLVTDPKAAAREVRKILLDLKRTNGGHALGIA